MPLLLSSVDSNREKSKSACEGNVGSGNEFAKKSWVSGINCDAKHEGGFPGKDAKEDARISAATVATNVPDAVSSKGASTSQHLAGSPSVALSCSPSKD